MTTLSKKYKTFSITHYYRGIELSLICVTTSKKKFSEISGVSLHHVNSYAHSYNLRYPVCNENPDMLFAMPGLGGESREIFDRNDIKPYEEFKEIIDKHRETYLTYSHYIQSKVTS